ncbi:MAG: LysM peptidoglycan-binding domain-containing protein [Bacteriovoracaceae bacterium]|jgi:membrane-bound lytic murein transglycosylase D|nr:LysM peptidoglycan-binding domain-containing protein [Bacteriovoracaceae bacterium]
MNKLIILLSLCFTISCSTTQKKYSNEQATVQIRNYKLNTQKIELSNIIDKKKTRSSKDFLENKRNTDTKKWIKYFSTNGKDTLKKYLKRGNRYRNQIEEIFENNNLPKDLFYVGLIESGYFLNAKSSASAVGPWQFMKATAKRYGLKVNSRVDERKHIIKSTKAAALYFQDLYNIFGSWELALSAYNAGEFGVIRRIRGADSRDFYKLSAKKKLPRETRNYVPKIIAAMEVSKNSHFYGVNIPTNRAPSTQLKKVTLDKQYSIRQLERKTGISSHTLKFFNTDIKGYYTPNTRGYELYIPKYSNFNPPKITRTKKYKKKKEPKESTDFHKVRRGENLTLIARKYKTSVSKLKAINQLTNSKIHPGMKLSLRKMKLKKAYRKVASYRVKGGDNLHLISKKYKTSISKLVQMNKLKSKRIYKGQRLKVPHRNFKYHVVKNGEYLLKIAKKYRLSLNKIRSLNGKRLARIYPGQKLIIGL